MLRSSFSSFGTIAWNLLRVFSLDLNGWFTWLVLKEGWWFKKRLFQLKNQICVFSPRVRRPIFFHKFKTYGQSLSKSGFAILKMSLWRLPRRGKHGIFGVSFIFSLKSSALNNSASAPSYHMNIFSNIDLNLGSKK